MGHQVHVIGSLLTLYDLKHDLAVNLTSGVPMTVGEMACHGGINDNGDCELLREDLNKVEI